MKKNLILIIVLQFIFCFVRAQQKINLSSSFKEYQSNAYQEKVFIHTNKSVLVAGETLWFSIFCVDGFMHRLSDLSKVVYLEILDEQYNPIAQLKIKLKSGRGQGSVFIPIGVQTGNYMLRGYTRWMRNFSEKFFFHTPLTIINTLKNAEGLSPEQKRYNIKFVPEGGTMVAGLETKVGFIGADQFNKGNPFSGKLINAQGETILNFRSDTFGIGSFIFTPKNEQYKAVVNIAGTSKTVLLPKVSSNKYSLQLHEKEEVVELKIKSSTNDYEKLYLLGHCRGMLHTDEDVFLQLNEASIPIDKSVLGEGVNQFTLFNEKYEPICERLYFKLPDNNLNISIANVPNNLRTRQNISFEILSGSPSISCSVSVSRQDSLEKNNNRNILNYVLLESDLGVVFENAGYYLKNEEALDNLMLVSTYDRFKWENVTTSNFLKPLFIPEYRNHLVLGKVTNKLTGESAASIPTYLGVPGKPLRLNVDISNKDGMVLFEMNDFYGDKEIVVQNNYEKDSIYNIELENPFYTGPVSWHLPSLDLSSVDLNSLRERSIQMQVLNTYFKDEQSKTLNLVSDTLPFYGKADKEYYLEDYTRFSSLGEIFVEYVKEAWIKKRKEKYYINLFKPDGSLHNENPLTIIDGIPVFDLNAIIEYDPYKMKKVELVRNTYHYGPLSFSGILNFETVNGNLEGYSPNKKALIISYSGLEKPKEFTSLDYSQKENKNNNFPDYRNQLIWNGNINVEEKDTCEVNFSTSDLTGEYKVTVQAISNEGKPLVKEIVFKVSR